MRESRPYGSVRGALSNERPYRDSARYAPRPLSDCRRSVKGRITSLKKVKNSNFDPTKDNA